MRIRAHGWAPPSVAIYSSTTGDVSVVRGERRWAPHGALGTGRAYGDAERAKFIAVNEALERYASLTYDDRELYTAPSDSLGDDALPLDSIPTCSARELRRRDCPVREARPDEAIRWIEGVELISGREVLVPAVMVFLMAERWLSERFWIPISTGCAIHESRETALLAAICEVIERDAISVTWLQKLPLSRLSDECLSDPTREIIDWLEAHQVATHLFDATTDLGIPTVYCVQTADFAMRGAQLVSADTDFDVERAAEKAVCECLGLRAALPADGSSPRRYADYREVADGAAEMGRPSRRQAFGFLLEGVEDRPVTSPDAPSATTAHERLRHLLKVLADREMPVFAVDISTRELDEFGLVAVRAVIPRLQPMSLQPRAQYRGHSRLYELPPKLGFQARRERELNPWPQPMA